MTGRSESRRFENAFAAQCREPDQVEPALEFRAGMLEIDRFQNAGLCRKQLLRTSPEPQRPCLRPTLELTQPLMHECDYHTCPDVQFPQSCAGFPEHYKAYRMTASLTFVRFDRVFFARLADWLAVAVAIALPWSTSAVARWLSVLQPSLDMAAVRRELVVAAGGLPVVLWCLGVRSFRRSPNGVGVMSAFSYHRLRFWLRPTRWHAIPGALGARVVQVPFSGFGDLRNPASTRYAATILSVRSVLW